MKKYKFLDLSGYAFTGKHALIDLVREFKGYYVPHFEFEFCFLRIQGGLLDLKTALMDDWSPIRSDAAIRRFKRLVKRIGGKNSILNPKSWFSAMGWNYDEYFNNRFFELSNQYINQLIEYSWYTDLWPYPLADLSNSEIFLRKLKKKLGFKKAYSFEMYLSYPENFIMLTREYLRKLLSANVSVDTETIVMHNAFEPFNPQRSLNFFNSAKCIIVDRDPRDNYVAGLWYKPTALPVDKFIKRYRLYRDVAKRNTIDSSNILRIKFEDLVINYKNTLSLILDFLEEDESVHICPKKYFDPTVSIKNIGIWKNYKNQEEIETIHRELKEFCYKLNS